MDKTIMKKFSSFKQALTRYFADKKLFATIAVFIKYLVEKEAYLSYSEESLFNYMDSETYSLDEGTKK